MLLLGMAIGVVLSVVFVFLLIVILDSPLTRRSPTAGKQTRCFKPIVPEEAEGVLFDCGGNCAEAGCFPRYLKCSNCEHWNNINTQEYRPTTPRGYRIPGKEADNEKN